MIRVSCAFVGLAVAFLSPEALPQELITRSDESSWEEARSDVIVRDAGGHEHAAGEILLCLEGWDHLEAVSQAVEQRGARITGGIPRLASVKVSLPPGRVAHTERGSFEAIVGVRWATLNYVGRLYGEPVPTPDDTSFGLQWHLVNPGHTPLQSKPDADIDILEAWRIQPGNPEVVVAIIDTGIRMNHVEFQGRLVAGWDFVAEDPDPQSGAEHGNLVAGVLGANGNNGLGVSGVDTRCSIMPIRAMTPGVIFQHDVAQALDYVAARGVEVVNMSWGFHDGQPMPLGDLALQVAHDAGCVLVAAAGNDPFTPISADESWPANSPLTISIGWTDRRDFAASLYPFGSPFGQTLDFVAPGVEIATVANAPLGDGVTVSSGSSLAAPIAAGIASLIRAERPDLTPGEVFEVMRLGAEDAIQPFNGLSGDPPGWDDRFGYGRLNAGRSLSLLCACDGSEDFRGAPVVLEEGEPQALTVDAGPDGAGLAYLILGSAAGTLPGQVFGDQHVPLNPDPYWSWALSGTSPLIRGPVGRLNSLGRAQAQVRFPPAYLPSLEGMVLHHAYAIFENNRPAATSSPVPVTSSPAAEPQRLVPEAAMTSDHVGGDLELTGGGPSVSVCGDVLVAGGFTVRKKAYVFRREGLAWSEEQTLGPSNVNGSSGFGNAVAVDGDHILVGARSEDSQALNAGAVYAFQWDGSAWKEIQKLVASDAHASQRFGWSVAVSDGVAVVGDNDVATQPGAAYVFRWNGGLWVEEQKLVAGAPGDKFGSSVAIHEDVVLVGARRADGAVSDSGAASVFRWDGGRWVQEQRLTAGEGAVGDGFGGAVAVSGDLALIGCHLADEATEDVGAAYLFQWQGGAWAEIQKLVAPEGKAGDFFGWSVALEGDRAAVGAPREDYLMPGAGTAYVYQWRRSELLPERRLFPPGGGIGLAGNPVHFDRAPTEFGVGVALRDGEVLIGAPRADTHANDTGAIYRFVLY